jgi:hypothetical protein
MKTLLLTVAAAALAIGLQSEAAAQQRFSNVERVAEAVEEKIREATPGWSVEKPAPPSRDGGGVVNDKVALRQWSLSRKRVKVAVLQHQSEAEAEQALRQFAADKRSDDRLHGLGDEAFSWGVSGSIAFRQGNLTIYISAVVVEEADPGEARTDPAAARDKLSKAERDEEANLSRGFAQRVAEVLKKL